MLDLGHFLFFLKAVSRPTNGNGAPSQHITGYFIYCPITIQLLSRFAAVLSQYQIEAINIACVWQFLSDESHCWFKLAQNEEANDMLTYNLASFQLISNYGRVNN